MDSASRSLVTSESTSVDTRFRIRIRFPVSVRWMYASRSPAALSDGARSGSANFVTRASSPLGARRHSRASFIRPRTNQIAPSAPTVGCISGALLDVSRSAVSGCATRMRNRSSCPSRLETNTSAVPSGLHAGCRSHIGPRVSCVHACPFASRTQISPSMDAARRPSRENAISRTGSEVGWA